MSTYWIGDLQGCNASLGRLLEVLGFSPSRDRLVILGDLINRGPDNQGVLDRLMNLGSSADCLLGNHDLFVLAAYHGAKSLKRGDTASGLLTLPQASVYMDWLASRAMARRESGCLLVHAGVLPQWDADQTLRLANEVEEVLRGAGRDDFMHQMFGNSPAQWHEDLAGAERLRVIVNALTRLRFCTAQGEMEFTTKEGLAGAPPGHWAWFEVPNRGTAQVPVVFGHWSTVGGLCRSNLACLDTGCLWGRQLSALCVPDTPTDQQTPDLTSWEWVSVPADPADVVPLQNQPG
jgi:bis(5'-nucleosyl)-tetraphosphatase (symmetrical)